MRSIRLSSVVLFGVALLGGCPKSSEPDPSRPDASVGPAADAAADARAALPSRCWPGTAAPCDCPSGPPGYHYCVERNVWGDCECAPEPMEGPDAGEPGAGGTEPDAGSGSSGGDGGGASGAGDGGGASGTSDGGGSSGTGDGGGSSGTGDGGTAGGHACTGDPEWCDGRDNDCDGVVDNGEPCPDSSVRYTLPYDGGVWLLSYREDCRGHRLQRVWPSVSTDVIDLPCGSEWPRFRPSDGALLYEDDGVYRYVASGPDLHVDDTPPCFDKRGYFDAEGNIYYQCDRTLRRNDGELLTSSLEEHDGLRGLLPPERFVVSDYAADTFRLLDSGGATLSTPPVEEWVGSMENTWSSVVTRGDHAFVTYTRKYRAGTRQEVVVFRVGGADDVWRKVRRVPVDSAIQRQSLALPDGHVFHLRHDNGSGRRQWIRVYPPGEVPREILDDDDDDNRSPETWSRLLPGPRAL